MCKKVKTFEFEISNWSLGSERNDVNKNVYDDAKAKLSSPDEIDETVNEFCKGKTIIDVKTTTATFRQRSNGCDLVKLIYTVIYEDFA